MDESAELRGLTVRRDGLEALRASRKVFRTGKFVDEFPLGLSVGSFDDLDEVYLLQKRAVLGIEADLPARGIERQSAHGVNELRAISGHLAA
jgi:hypothetical protein